MSYRRYVEQIAFGLVIFLLWLILSGCAAYRDHDLTLDPSYSDLSGHTFTTKRDLAICKDGREYYLTARADVKIVAELPLGTRLRVTRVIARNDFEDFYDEPYVRTDKFPHEMSILLLRDYSSRGRHFQPEPELLE